MLIMYTKEGCPWCKDALSFMVDHDVEFEEREVRNNSEWFEELEEKSGQNKTPTLDLDGEIIADVDASEIEVFLKEKGIL